MKIITTTNGYETMVDDEDYGALLLTRWHGRKTPAGIYVTSTQTVPIGMHRVIMSAVGKTQIVDHKDGNPLNNQKHNLRICTYSQNSANRRVKKNKSGSLFLGVTFCNDKFQVEIAHARKREKVGSFIREIDAAQAYNEAAIIYHGEYARLNPIPSKQNYIPTCQDLVLDMHPRAYSNYIYTNKTWAIYIPCKIKNRIAITKGNSTEDLAWINAAHVIKAHECRTDKPTP